MPGDNGIQRLACTIEQRMQALLDRPKMWGDPMSVELQFLQLLELRLEIEQPGTSQDVMSTWRSMGSSNGGHDDLVDRLRALRQACEGSLDLQTLRVVAIAVDPQQRMLCVLKTRGPDHELGKLHGIAGSVSHGESVERAVARHFDRQCGVGIAADRFRRQVQYDGPYGCTVIFYVALTWGDLELAEWSTRQVGLLGCRPREARRTPHGEEMFLVPVDELLSRQGPVNPRNDNVLARPVELLRWAVPLVRDRSEIGRTTVITTRG